MPRSPPRDAHNKGYRRGRDEYARRSSRSRSPPPRSSLARSPRSRRRDSPPPRERERDRDRDRDGRRKSRSPYRRRSRSRDSRPREGREEGDSKRPPPSLEPNFGASGLLAAATNTVTTVDGKKTVLKYNEPPEARKPGDGWRLYVFKGKEELDMLQLHRQSAYLFGRDGAVCDVTLDHSSCSKQHAVIQYRHITERSEWGETTSSVKPFVIDLESTNGTMVNDDTIPTSRYYELKVGDVIKFGLSTREYVLLNENA